MSVASTLLFRIDIRCLIWEPSITVTDMLRMVLTFFSLLILWISPLQSLLTIIIIGCHKIINSMISCFTCPLTNLSIVVTGRFHFLDERLGVFKDLFCMLLSLQLIDKLLSHWACAIWVVLMVPMIALMVGQL